MRGARWLVPSLVLATAGAWRFGSETLGFAASAVTLVVALWTGFGARPSPALQCLLAVIGAAIAVLGLVESWWPCELSCSAGEAYSILFDVPVSLLAAVALLLLAAVAFRARAGGGRCRLTRAGAWLMAGSSAYYCGLSIHLEMVCGHCLSVHTAVFSAAFVALTGWGMVGSGVVLAAVAAAGMHTLYNPGWVGGEKADGPAPVEEVPAPRDPLDPSAAPTGPTAEGSEPGTTGPAASTAPPTLGSLQGEARALAERIDRVRRIGSDDAPLVVEFVYAFTCGTCSKVHNPTVTLLGRLAEEGKVQLVLRHFVSMRDRDGVELLKVAFAAAARGTYDEFTQKAFNTQRAGVTLGESLRGSKSRRLLNRLEKTYDPDALRALVAENPEVYEALVREEARAVKKLGASGEMPRVFLLDRGGEVLFELGGHEFQPMAFRNEVVRRAAAYEQAEGEDGAD